MDTAKGCVLKGDCIGYMHFASNFSEATMMRREEGRFTNDEDLIAGELQVYMDMSSKDIYS